MSRYSMLMRGLECWLKNPAETNEECEDRGCPFAHSPDCSLIIMANLYEWLKNQPPVKPINITRRFFGIPVTSYQVCGNCGEELTKGHYCPVCGRMIKVEES